MDVSVGSYACGWMGFHLNAPRTRIKQWTAQSVEHIIKRSPWCVVFFPILLCCCHRSRRCNPVCMMKLVVNLFSISIRTRWTMEFYNITICTLYGSDVVGLIIKREKKTPVMITFQLNETTFIPCESMFVTWDIESAWFISLYWHSATW